MLRNAYYTCGSIGYLIFLNLIVNLSVMFYIFVVDLEHEDHGMFKYL